MPNQKDPLNHYGSVFVKAQNYSKYFYESLTVHKANGFVLFKIVAEHKMEHGTYRESK